MAAGAPWLDKKNLEEWLQTPVKEVQSEDNNAKDHYLSNLKRMKVTSDSGDVYHLIAKCHRTSGMVAELFNQTNIYKKEQHMYSTTLKKLEELLLEAIPDFYEHLVPHCYHSCEDFIVLEDLSAKGYTLEDRQAGMNLEQSLLVMRALARYHAASVVLHEQDPAAYEKYDVPICSEPCLQEPFQKFLKGMANTLAEELETWPEEWHKYAGYLRNMAGDMQKIAREVTMRSDPEFNVLIHGDLWTNNILLKNKAERLRFLDFQLVHFGSPAVDIHYFIATSASLDVRVNHLDQIIQEYHNTLCETLTALGYNKELITLTELNELIDKKAIYGVHTIAMSYVVIQMDAGVPFSFDDCLATASNPGRCMYSENYKKAIKFLLPFYESKGAFDNYR